jgi:hypothetical protein
MLGINHLYMDHFPYIKLPEVIRQSLFSRWSTPQPRAALHPNSCGSRSAITIQYTYRIIYIIVYIYTLIYTYVNVYIYIFVYNYICMYIYIYVYLYIYVCISLSINQLGIASIIPKATLPLGHRGDLVTLRLRCHILGGSPRYPKTLPCQL